MKSLKSPFCLVCLALLTPLAGPASAQRSMVYPGVAAQEPSLGKDSSRYADTQRGTGDDLPAHPLPGTQDKAATSSRQGFPAAGGGSRRPSPAPGLGKAEAYLLFLRLTDQSRSSVDGSSVMHDRRGRITRLGGAPVEYDRSGRVTRFAGAAVDYDMAGRIVRFGGDIVNHDSAGRPVMVGQERISYDSGGRVTYVGKARVDYDSSGRITRIGDKPVGYDSQGRWSNYGGTQIRHRAP
jgi:hypothetical protein